MASDVNNSTRQVYSLVYNQCFYIILLNLNFNLFNIIIVTCGFYIHLIKQVTQINMI